MNIRVLKDPPSLGQAAAEAGGMLIRAALREQEKANVVIATGTSQFETLAHLVRQDLEWSRVNVFHLDEYIGLDDNHPASFRKYIRQRFVEKVPALASVTYINGNAKDLESELDLLNKAVSRQPVDVSFIGIGENAHIAFNDPPADFETDAPYIRVKLDEACRRQQLGEGWFHSLEEVPRYAISMSVKQIMRSKNIIGSIPDRRKATAVKYCVECNVSNTYPASALQQHLACTLFLDSDSASLLDAGSTH